jgi:hypothetical protein
VTQLDSVIQNNTAASEELAAAAEELSGQALSLREQVSYFKFKGNVQGLLSDGDPIDGTTRGVPCHHRGAARPSASTIRKAVVATAMVPWPYSADTISRVSRRRHAIPHLQAWGNRIAVEVSAVETVVDYAGVTAVPSPLAYVRGVMDLRGRTVAVETAEKFGLAPASRRPLPASSYSR